MMVRLEMKNYNMIVMEKLQKYWHYHQLNTYSLLKKYFEKKKKKLKIKVKIKLKQLKSMENN